MQADLLCPFTPALKLTLKERDDEPHKRLSQNGFSQSQDKNPGLRTRPPTPPASLILWPSRLSIQHHSLPISVRGPSRAHNERREEEQERKSEGGKKNPSQPARHRPPRLRITDSILRYCLPLFSFHKVVHGPFIYSIRMD